jgi:plasmid stabilization system protein ParE
MARYRVSRPARADIARILAVSADDPATKVKRPVHSLYYRAIGADLIEILRALHERMEPGPHMGEREG